MATTSPSGDHEGEIEQASGLPIQIQPARPHEATEVAQAIEFGSLREG